MILKESGSMADATPLRLGPLSTLAAAQLPSPAAALQVLPDAAKFIFRGRQEAVLAAGRAFGAALPETACRSAIGGERTALWLGPDEWLLIAPRQEEDEIAQTFAAALAGVPHALVAVSHRNCGVEIAGEQAATVLNGGCPLDLDLGAFPVGMCTRTILGKAEIVLWRTAVDTFRIEVWRSFASYVWNFLEEARSEFR
jgi:sarcosine oxidase subunit gamma